ncbi:protein THEM6-like [Mizuhopecten yessoensis]|uniref:Protein THEM6 n=1 Tax=Mizuhopecten yessoensis TaxID=6573 RepID=A0A210Q664_MIZYE|nr:protein THEM6-like [Mizuhopecten yessoensis]OWF44227.1 Protein THEM6 [Mizuhopecten yessoensis]
MDMVVCFLLLFVIFDASYYLRQICLVIMSVIRRRSSTKHLLESSVIEGIVLMNDLDLQFHMNNARYLRECDFGRTKLWIENRIIGKIGIGRMVRLTNAAASVRYRKSLQLFNRYKIVSKVIFWDEKAFYVEQQILRQPDDFVCAVIICKQSVIGCSPDSLVQKLSGHSTISSPPKTRELQSLLESWQHSSDRLNRPRVYD